eukprot:TRINITY_DN3341_c0_g1_i2.p1 TRINITY_DN3341_c0_g1~~TRINITY_DN3341_c0_g1_i2.p1  ORF type:complete len:212 (+),score=34.59 TRINITY_DN3341_c0_g1_i2:61-696(+)
MCIRDRVSTQSTWGLLKLKEEQHKMITEKKLQELQSLESKKVEIEDDLMSIGKASLASVRDGFFKLTLISKPKKRNELQVPKNTQRKISNKKVVEIAPQSNCLQPQTKIETLSLTERQLNSSFLLMQQLKSLKDDLNQIKTPLFSHAFNHKIYSNGSANSSLISGIDRNTSRISQKTNVSPHKLFTRQNTISQFSPLQKRIPTSCLSLIHI